MNQKELARRVRERLHNDKVKKPVTTLRHKFTISSEEGDSKVFTVRGLHRSVEYTIEDVNKVLAYTIEAIKDAMRHGEEISIIDFGTLAPHYRKAHRTVDPKHRESVNIPAHYIPKFTPGKGLRLALKLWEVEQQENRPLYESVDDDA